MENYKNYINFRNYTHTSRQCNSVFKIISILFIGINIPSILLANDCKLYEETYTYGVKSKFEIFKNKLITPPEKKIFINIKLDKKFCHKKEYPIKIEISNKSNNPVSQIKFDVGSWLDKDNGNSIYVNSTKHHFKDGIKEDFYIKPGKTFYTCTRAPTISWKYKKVYNNPNNKYEGFTWKQDKIIKQFKVNELSYGLVKDSCYVDFKQ